MTSIRYFFTTPTGKAVAAWCRTFAATLVGSWLAAGIPLTWNADGFTLALQLAIGTATTLVAGNAVGPWEHRYGVAKKDPQEG